MYSLNGYMSACSWQQAAQGSICLHQYAAFCTDENIYQSTRGCVTTASKETNSSVHYKWDKEFIITDIFVTYIYCMYALLCAYTEVESFFKMI